MPSLLRQLKALRHRLFYGALLRSGYPVIELGDRSTGCNWRLFTENLNARSVIYSGGIGRDITFEHALVERFDCSIVMFDPSPTGLETMSKAENKIPAFKYCTVGLAAKCGRLKMTPPQDSREGSWSSNASGEAGTIEVPCVDLATLLAQNDHSRIDLLKIDIEGAEYEVLDDLLRRRLPIRQILVEFHHQMVPGIRRSQTIQAVLKLVARGYRLIQLEGNNHTFFWSGKWP
jgi:FkbM family methyltransferase